MKCQVIVFFFLVIASFQGYGQVDTSKINEFALLLFNSIKNNDIQEFNNLQINKDKMKKGFDVNIKDESRKKRWMDIVDENWDIVFEDFVIKNRISFDSLYMSCKNIKLKWSDTEFSRFVYAFSNKDPDLKYLYGDIIFYYENKEYYFSVKDVILLDGEWYLAELGDVRVRLK